MATMVYAYPQWDAFLSHNENLVTLVGLIIIGYLIWMAYHDR